MDKKLKMVIIFLVIIIIFVVILVVKSSNNSGSGNQPSKGNGNQPSKGNGNQPSKGNGNSKTKYYACSYDKCVPVQFGQHTTKDCDGKCVVNSPRYGCKNNKCELVKDGKYKDASCSDRCGKWSCIEGGKCVVNDNGEFDTENECYSKGCGKWSCDSNNGCSMIQSQSSIKKYKTMYNTASECNATACSVKPGTSKTFNIKAKGVDSYLTINNTKNIINVTPDQNLAAKFKIVNHPDKNMAIVDENNMGLTMSGGATDVFVNNNNLSHAYLSNTMVITYEHGLDGKTYFLNPTTGKWGKNALHVELVEQHCGWKCPYPSSKNGCTKTCEGGSWGCVDGKCLCKNQANNTPCSGLENNNVITGSDSCTTCVNKCFKLPKNANGVCTDI